MSEVDYFNTTGTTITISAISNGSTNLARVNVPSVFTSIHDSFDNGGANTGRLRFLGTLPRHFHIAITLSVLPVSGGGSDNIVMGLAISGVLQPNGKILERFTALNDVHNIVLHAMVHLMPNDYVDVYLGNMTAGRNVVVKTLNFFAMGL